MSNIKLLVNGDEAWQTFELKFVTCSDGDEIMSFKDEGTSTMPAPKYFKRVCKRGKNSVVISVSMQDCVRDVYRIELVKDMLDNCLDFVPKVSLSLKYMPGARADKRFTELSPLPVRIMANRINAMNFAKVLLDDPHSEVTTSLLNRCFVHTQADYLPQRYAEITSYMGDFTLCAPDNGAAKKIFDVMKALGHTDFIQAGKIRDVTTGNIVMCKVPANEVTESVLIVDDLSDGGASFKFLAKKLKEYGAKQVGLYVTHAIFSNGLAGLEEDIDFIFCKNIVGKYINYQDISDFNERH